MRVSWRSRDILVTLTSYPEPTPVSVVEDAISVAAALGAHIAALSCEVHVQVPGHFISGSVVGLPGIIAGEAGKSRRNAQDLLAAFEAAAAKSGVSRESILQKCKSFEVPDLLVEYARLRDLTIMPESNDRWYAEAVIFGSGRPILVLPQNPRSRPFEIGTVAVAWDFSRAAARAVSDAIPLLEKAKKVRVVTVLNEKHLDRQAFRRRIVEEPVPARHRRRAGQGRRQGQADRRRARGLCCLACRGHARHGCVRTLPSAGICAGRRDQEPAVEAAAADPVFALMASDPPSKARSRCGGGSAWRCWCCMARASRWAPASTS